MSQRSLAGTRAVPATVLALLLILVCLPSEVAQAKASAERSYPHSALGGFVKDRALARALGETLFRDTVEMMSTHPELVSATTRDPVVPDPTRDNSAVGQVARKLLAHQSLDKYLWLIQRAYSDSLWRGGNRARIEQHFPLIWRTSIMLYESSLDDSPARVRVCSTDDNGDTFDCRDEIEHTRVVPIPSQMPLFGPRGQPNIG